MGHVATALDFDFFDARFIYDPVTGSIKNKTQRNTAMIGALSGYVDNNGYRIMRCLGKLYKGHRVAWLLNYGDIDPLLQVDHINCVRHDNRIVNLRLVDHRGNCANRAKKRSLPTGVSWHKPSNKYTAQAVIKGKKKYLGVFSDPDEAHRVYLKALAETE